MRKLLFLMLVSLILGMGTAYAQPFVQVKLADSANNFTALDVNTMDWSSSGSGVATAIGPFGTELTVGTTFDFMYQASLVGLADINGNNIAFAGLNTDFEYTIVAKFGEEVLSFTDSGLANNIGDTAIFSTTGGSWYMYYDNDPSDTSVPDGEGFDDGVLVASGSISANQISNFTITGIDEGIGSAIIEGLVGFVNSEFIMEMPDELTIFDFRFEGTQNYPPLDSTTTDFFRDGDGGDNDGNLTAYNVDTSGTVQDLLLKVDGSSKFTPIPEPSTMLLLGMGLLGLGGLARRKIKNN